MRRAGLGFASATAASACSVVVAIPPVPSMLKSVFNFNAKCTPDRAPSQLLFLL